MPFCIYFSQFSFSDHEECINVAEQEHNLTTLSKQLIPSTSRVQSQQPVTIQENYNVGHLSGNFFKYLLLIL